MVGTRQLRPRPAHAFLFHRIVAVPQAGGVDQGQGHFPQADLLAQDIPGGPGHRGDYGPVVTGQGIEQ